MNWTFVDTWTVLACALAGAACALPGCFLVLRRLSMMGDAISHAVLPGIVIAFMVSGGREAVPMLVGAILAGLGTAVLTQWLTRLGDVDEGASMGVVFTLMFAGGLFLVERVGHNIDLDLDCVLFGTVETIVLHESVTVFGLEFPVPVFRLLAVCIVNALVVLVFYKEWRISSFDEQLSSALGVSAGLMHYILMVITSVTCVFSFEIVGSILVIAMLIVPAACARLLTDRMGPMILWSVLMAVVFAFSGHLAASALPPLWGIPAVSSTGAIAFFSGLVFGLVMLFAPRYGIVPNLRHQRKLFRETLSQDVLARLYRYEVESKGSVDEVFASLQRESSVSRGMWNRVLKQLRQESLLDEKEIRLSKSGRAEGLRLIRSHRLWEQWLHENTNLAMDHLHFPAEALEHVTDARIQQQLSVELDQTDMDPMGREIPKEKQSES